MIKAFLNLVLIGLIFASVVGYTLSRLQDPDFLIEQAREVNLYGRAKNLLPTLMPAQDIPGLALSQTDQISILTRAIDGETFYDFLDKYLTFHLGWFRGEIKQYQFDYNFTQAKERAEQRTTEILLTRYNDLPICQRNQLRNWDAAVQFPSCKLSDEVVTRDSDIGALLARLASGLINAVDETGKEVFPSVFKLDSPSPDMIQARNVIATANRAITAIWLVTVIFLAGYILLFRRGAFFSLAFIFIAVGLLQVGFSLIAWDWLARALVDFFAASQFKDMVSLIAEIVGASLEVLKTIMGSFAIISLAVGAVSLVIGIVLSVRAPKVISF